MRSNRVASILGFTCSGSEITLHRLNGSTNKRPKHKKQKQDSNNRRPEILEETFCGHTLHAKQ